MADPHDDGEDIENDGSETKSSTPNEFPDRKPCADTRSERETPAELTLAWTKGDPIECQCETGEQRCREYAPQLPAARLHRHEDAAQDECQARGNRYEHLTRETIRRMNRSTYGGAHHHKTDFGRDNAECDPAAAGRDVAFSLRRLARLSQYQMLGQRDEHHTRQGEYYEQHKIRVRPGSGIGQRVGRENGAAWA